MGEGQLILEERLKCPKCHSNNTMDKPREYYAENRAGSLKGKRKPKRAICKDCGYENVKWKFQRGIMTNRPVCKTYCSHCKRKVWATTRDHICQVCGGKAEPPTPKEAGS